MQHQPSFFFEMSDKGDIMKKQPEITAQTRENLLHAFWQLYQLKPLSMITVRDITSKAGYNRCTFYAYFLSVQDILEQLEDSLIDYIKDNVANSLLPTIFRGEVPNLSELYIHTKGEYLSVMLGKDGDPRFIDKLKQALFEVYYKSFSLPINDIRTEYILDFKITALLAVLIRWYSKADLPEEEVVSLLGNLLSR